MKFTQFGTKEIHEKIKAYNTLNQGNTPKKLNEQEGILLIKKAKR